MLAEDDYDEEDAEETYVAKKQEKISTVCIEIFQLMERIKGGEFDMDDVEGGSEDVEVINWEHFTIAMTYIADCHTYKIEPDLENINIIRQRDKLVDTFLMFLKFR